MVSQFAGILACMVSLSFQFLHVPSVLSNSYKYISRLYTHNNYDYGRLPTCIFVFSWSQMLLTSQRSNTDFLTGFQKSISHYTDDNNERLDLGGNAKCPMHACPYWNILRSGVIA